jgi:hypothetical protein
MARTMVQGGVFYGYGKQLAAQLTEILYVWSFVGMNVGGYFLILRFLGLLRVPPEVGILGNDTSHHGDPAYPEDDVGLEEDLAMLRSYQTSQKVVQKASSSGSPAEERIAV